MKTLMWPNVADPTTLSPSDLILRRKLDTLALMVQDIRPMLHKYVTSLSRTQRLSNTTFQSCS